MPFKGHKFIYVLSLCISAALISFPSQLTAAPMQLAIKSESIFRLFERDTIKGTDEPVAPLYEYLQFDYGNLSSKGLSFHLYGWGRGDLAGSDFYEDDTEGELLYGYIRFRQPGTNLDLRLGRQNVYTGVAVNSFDGLRISTDLGPMFSLSLHGGQAVGYTSTNSRDGDMLYGGRISYHRSSNFDVGLSYENLENDSMTVREFIGLDASVALPGDSCFYGLVTYNLDTDKMAEQNYELRFVLAETLFRTFFEIFSYQDYFPQAPVAPQPFQFLAGVDETLQRYGFDATRPFGSWEAGLKYTHYDYDLKTDTADYAGLFLTWKGAGLQQVGSEIGFLNADTIDDEMLIARLFGYWDQFSDNSLLNFISGDVVYTATDKAFFGEDTTLFSSIGVGRFFLDRKIELKLSGDYTSGSYYDEDIRGMFILTYRIPN